MTSHADISPQRAVPRPALLLGWLGVTPFAALSAASIAAPAPAAGTAAAALVVYATVILSFMGGAQWGLAMAAPRVGTAALTRRLAISVLPALAAFALAALSWRFALAGLAAVFAILLAYDLATTRTGIAPAWYPALRIPLTMAVETCLLLAAAFGAG